MSELSITPEENKAPESDVDPTKLEQMTRQMHSEQSFTLALLGGFLASVGAAVIWALITYATNYQIGFMAIGVGILVGYAVRFFGNGLTSVYGVIGAAFAVFGCLFGNLLTSVIVASNLESSSFLGVLLALVSSPGLIPEIMIETFSPIDLLFYGIAIYEAYRFSIRQVTEEEMSSIRKTPTQI